VTLQALHLLYLEKLFCCASGRKDDAAAGVSLQRMEHLAQPWGRAPAHAGHSWLGRSQLLGVDTCMAPGLPVSSFCLCMMLTAFFGAFEYNAGPDHRACNNQAQHGVIRGDCVDSKAQGRSACFSVLGSLVTGQGAFSFACARASERYLL